MQNTSNRKLVASRQYEKKNLLVVNSYITIEGKQNGFIAKELIYLEFYKGYDRNTKVSMSMNSLELRELYYGCKELYSKGSTNYKNHTNAALSDKTKSDLKGIKTLQLGRFTSTVNSFMLNIQEKRDILFEAYSFLSFMDSIKNIADETEQCLFKIQRQLAKNR
jgi:hypothetical protein